jgi:hypothetical protein
VADYYFGKWIGGNNGIGSLNYDTTYDSFSVGISRITCFGIGAR